MTEVGVVEALWSRSVFSPVPPSAIGYLGASNRRLFCTVRRVSPM